MNEVKMNVDGILMTNIAQASLLLLTPSPDNDQEYDFKLPIRVGFADAGAIGLHAESRKDTRPYTHDLIKDICEALGATVVHTVIDGVEGSIFYAKVTLETDSGKTIVLDTRPTDALILAFLFHIDFYVTEEVLVQAGIPASEAELMKPNTQKLDLKDLDKFDDFLDNIDLEDF